MFSIVEICSLNDPLLLPWLDLYETAFPPGERILVSCILNVLHDRAGGLNPGSHLLAAVMPPAAGENAIPTDAPPALQDPGSPGNRLLSMLFVYEPPDGQAAFLWYFAVDPRMRGQGLGGQIYQGLLARLDPRARALIFDLEDPAQMATPGETRQAERRIAFYRRLGARLLGGIRYIQTVGPHQPPLPLRLMVHPIQDLSPQQAFDLARAEFGAEILNQVGELRWE